MPVDYGERQYYGTPQSLGSTGGTVAAGNFSSALGTDYNNTTDALYPDAPMARAVLSFSFSVAPAAGTVIELWELRQNVDSTTDESDAPTGTTSKGARCVGSFLCTDVTTGQVRSCEIPTVGLKQARYYLKNGTGQTLATGAALILTPITFGLRV